MIQCPAVSCPGPRQERLHRLQRVRPRPQPFQQAPGREDQVGLQTLRPLPGRSDPAGRDPAGRFEASPSSWPSLSRSSPRSWVYSPGRTARRRRRSSLTPCSVWWTSTMTGPSPRRSSWSTAGTADCFRTRSPRSRGGGFGDTTRRRWGNDVSGNRNIFWWLKIFI